LLCAIRAAVSSAICGPKKSNLATGQAAKIRSVHLSGASEHGARENRPHQAIVLMFDALGRDSATFAREGAMEVARGAAEADALVAVVCVGSRLGILQPFTGDKDALKKSIEIATVSASRRDVEITKAEEGLRRLPAQAAAAGGTPPAQLLLEAVSSSELAARDQKAKPAMASMLGLAKALAKLPGRKTIVYFSGGLQLSTSEATVFQSLVSESNLARVSLYAVDASGDRRSSFGASHAGGLHCHLHDPCHWDSRRRSRPGVTQRR